GEGVWRGGRKRDGTDGGRADHRGERAGSLLRAPAARAHQAVPEPDLALTAATLGAAKPIAAEIVYWRVSGPLTFFQASMPPWIWQAVASPASCAACTAMADRSPKAQ